MNKHMETKWHETKKLNGSIKKSKGKLEDTLDNDNETQHSKICEMQQSCSKEMLKIPTEAFFQKQK